VAVSGDFLFLLRNYQMKFKFLLFILCGFVVIGLTTNSCKKNNQDYIETLLPGGQWFLSSMTVTNYHGDTLLSTIKVDTICNFNQLFTFNNDKTCTFTNYSCDSSRVSGHWALTSDHLFLNSDIVVDSAGTPTKAFKNAQIVNLGQYSLVLQTGSLETFYPPDRKRIITRYGFVRQKTK
jgi:hypothetical protein